MRRRAWILTAVLIASAAGFVGIARRAPTPEAPTAPHPVAPAPTTDRASSAPLRTAAPSGAASPERSAPSTAAKGRTRLRAQVIGGSRDAPVALTVEVVDPVDITRAVQVLPVDADGVAEAKMTVEVEPKANLSARLRVGSTIASVHEAVAPVSEADGPAYLFRFDLTGQSLVAVRTSEGGRPRRAAVAAFTVHAGLPSAEAHAGARSGEDGEAWLAVPTSAETIVVVVPESGAPGAAALNPPLRPVERVVVDVAPAATIEGRLTRRGVPIVGAVVHAEWKGVVRGGHPTEARRRVGDAWVHLLPPNGVVASTSEATSDDDGRFRLGGLSRETYRLRLGAVPGIVSLVDESFDLVTLEAPTTGFEWNVSAAAVSIRLQGREALPDDLFVEVLWRGGGAVAAPDADGVLRLWVPGEQELRVAAIVENRRLPLGGALRSPRAGEDASHAFEFERRDATIRAQVQLSARGGGPVTSAQLTLRRQPTGEVFLRQTLDASDGRYVTAGLEPGVYSMHVVPGAAEGEPSSYWIPIDVELDLRGGRSVSLELTADVGGRVRVRGRRERLQTSSIGFVDDGGNLRPVATHRSTETEAAVVLTAPMPAGRYTVTIDGGDGNPTTRVVDVVAGQVVDMVAD